MATNPYPGLPRDKGQEPMQEYPAPIVAKARYGKENSSASSVITVGANTTAIEIAAVTTPAIMRWVTTTDTQASVVGAEGTANFDHVVPVGIRRFAIPIERFAPTSIAGANSANGLYARVAIKSTGVGSVLLTEY